MSGRMRRFQQVSVGVRRSPRAHTQSVVIATSSDEETDKLTAAETVVNDDDDAVVTSEASLMRDVSAVNNEAVMSDDGEGEGDDGTDGGGDGEGDDGTDGGGDGEADGEGDDEMVDVVDNDIEDDSATRSLSLSLSPYDGGRLSDVVTQLDCDNAANTSSLLPLDDSSEADSVDVVDDKHTSDVLTPHDKYTSDTPSPALMLPDSNEPGGLVELEEFVSKSGHGVDSGRVADAGVMADECVAVTESSQLTSALMTSEPAAPPSSAAPTHVDVRRGAMWRDSLFPSDFPLESSSSCDTVGGKSMTVGKFGGMGKPDVDVGSKAVAAIQRGAVLDWETGRQIDSRAGPCTTTSSCQQNFPTPTAPVSNRHYHYSHVLDQSLELAGRARYRYDDNSGRRSVNDAYSRGGGASYENEHQRAASVRPAAVSTASVDAQRLSHMWTGAPLPAHQHHVSLSHLQHLVTDDLQYAAPPPQPSSLPHNSCQQRQHGSRQPHKSHHKQTSSSHQLVHGPAASASLAAAAAAGYDMFSACRIQQPIGYLPHQGAAAALPMGVVGLHHAQMAVAAAANFAQPMPAGQAANSAMYSAAAAAAAYSYLNGGGLQPFNVDINSVMRR